VNKDDLGKLAELRDRIKGVSVTSERILIPNKHLFVEFRRGQTQYFKCTCSEYLFPARFLFVSPHALAQVYVSFRIPKPNKEKNDFYSMERDFMIDYIREEQRTSLRN
jgi:hypothetical protein